MAAGGDETPPPPPQMPPALSIKKRHVSHRTALISDTQRAQDKLMAGMSAKRSAAAACLLTALHRKSRCQTPLTAAAACLLAGLHRKSRRQTPLTAAAACLLAALHRKSRRQTPLTAAAACLLAGLCCLCSASWAQTTNERLCQVLDITEEDCPTFSSSDDSSAIWLVSTPSDSIGGKALRSGMIDHNQRSCLGVTLQRPVRVAFRWRVSSEASFRDRLHYIDDGRRSPAQPNLSIRATNSCPVMSAWRDASFDYSGNGPIGIEWCYIKDGSLDSSGDDVGYLDRLQVTPLLASVVVSPPQVMLPEGSSATLILSLDEAPQSNVTVKPDSADRICG